MEKSSVLDIYLKSFFNSVEPRVYAIAVQLPEQTDDEIKLSLDELKELVKTCGGKFVGSTIQKREKIDRTYYLGKGKMLEVKKEALNLNATHIVADDELSGLQIRQLEETIELPVIDRTGVIIEIFAKHASTKEGKLQVELAKMNYLLLRLTGGYKGLSRQRGGIGTKGPGEQQIERDRRLLKKRIQRLNQELNEIVKHRNLQRQKREQYFTPLFSLVGYTNAGKSTLLNTLSKSNITTNNALFTTLDPVSRKVFLSANQYAIVSDTVGFIRKLPPTLVKAFRATLENLINSHVLLHVCDISDPNFKQQITYVEDILREINAISHERILIFNKIDLISNHLLLENIQNLFPNAIFISAKTGQGIDKLKQKMAEIISSNFNTYEIFLSNSDYIDEIISTLHPHAIIEEQTLTNEKSYKIKFKISKNFSFLIEKIRLKCSHIKQNK